MDCKETQRLFQPFLSDSLKLQDTSAVLEHLKNCTLCRDELELECIIHSALEDHEEEHSDFDFRHRLDDLLESRERRIRFCRLTNIMDIVLIILTAAAVLVKIVL